MKNQHAGCLRRLRVTDTQVPNELSTMVRIVDFQVRFHPTHAHKEQFQLTAAAVTPCEQNGLIVPFFQPSPWSRTLISTTPDD